MPIALTHSDESIIQAVNQLLNEAHSKQASDIHLEPYPNIYQIRFRIDGVLHKVREMTFNFGVRMVSRLKIISHLDIAESRLSQDGSWQHETTLATLMIRINTCLTINGEKVVLRLMTINQANLRLANLGMTTTERICLQTHLTLPQGLIIVAGPTGSGKTNTLYAALAELNTIQKNIITIEDPVEIRIHGLNQINIQAKIGLTYASILRNCLRQDPDVIMIGEIRDAETAHVALQAALTGHLVLATMHSHSVMDTIIRLHSLHVPLHLLLQALNLIVSQRLIRLRCNCCVEKQMDCGRCFAGYRGRRALFELVSLLTLKEQINANFSLKACLTSIQNIPRPSLQDNAFNLLQTGLTDALEIKRVLGNVQ